MSIKKRRLKAKPSQPKKKPKLVNPAKRKHQKRCDDLYNRLQAGYDDPIYWAMQEVSHELKLKIDVTIGTERLIEEIIKRCDCEVQTLQMNYPDHVSYRVSLSYTDKTKKPKHGYLYPTKYVVKTSHRLALAVTLSYVELCKHTGWFI